MKQYVFKLVASAAFAVVLANCAFAQTQAAPDNTANNRGQKMTADSQTNENSDRMLTAKIRRAIVADKELSTYAHNVKIVTMNGAVTLKGPVKSEDEKQKVAQLAVEATSADAVKNELTIK